MGEKRKSLDEFTEKALHYQKIWTFHFQTSSIFSYRTLKFMR